MSLDHSDDRPTVICPLLLRLAKDKNRKANAEEGELHTLLPTLEWATRVFLQRLLDTIGTHTEDWALAQEDGSFHRGMHCDVARVSLRQPTTDQLGDDGVIAWQDSETNGFPIQALVQTLTPQDVGFPDALKKDLLEMVKKYIDRLKKIQRETWETHKDLLTGILVKLSKLEREMTNNPSAFHFSEVEVTNYSLQMKDSQGKREPYLQQGFSLFLCNDLFEVNIIPDANTKAVKIKIELRKLKGISVNDQEINSVLVVQDPSYNTWVADLLEGMEAYVQELPDEGWKDNHADRTATLNTTPEVSSIREGLGERVATQTVPQE